MSAAQHTGTGITLVGTGNLASALAPALSTAGFTVDAIVSRPLGKSRARASSLARKVGAKAVLLDEVKPESEIIWLCHTDDAIAVTATHLAEKPGWKGRIVFHSSGALTSGVLAPLKSAGASTASLHPMMTFAHGTDLTLEGITFAAEGDRRAVAAARKIVQGLQARIFVIRKDAKVLYHALGAFSSPLLVAMLATAERVGRAAGLSPGHTRKVVGPILRQTLDNYLEHGAAAAYGGPMKRGDIHTVQQHLKELRKVPRASEVYRALIKSALTDLPAKNKAALLRALEE